MRSHRSRGASILVAAVATLTALAVVVPILYVCVRALERGWSDYMAIVATRFGVELLARTLLLVAGVVPLAIGIAVTYAWLVTRTDLPAARAFALLGAIPLVFPSYVAAFALVAVAGPKGYLQNGLAAFGVDEIPEIAYGYSGALLVLGFFTYPYIFLLAVAALRSLDPALEEAARSLGASRWRVFTTVVLPQLRPAIVSGSLLVTLYTLSDFGAVSVTRYNTFTLGIYNAYRGLLDRTTAAGLSTLLIAMTLAAIGIEMALLHRMRPPAAHVSRPQRRVRLGRWRFPAVSFICIVLAVSFAVPLATIIHWSTRAVQQRVSVSAVVLPALHSIEASLLAAVAAIILSIAPAIFVVRYPSLISRLAYGGISAGYALPGLVIALALVFFTTRAAPALYQTLPLLIAAYVIRYQPEAIAATRAALLRIPRELEEAARSLGATRKRVLRTVTLPLLRSGLLAGGGLVFMTSMKELPATLILRPTGFDTLATEIWTTVGEGFYAEAAVPSLILLLASIAPTYLFVIRPILSERRS